MSKIAPPMCGEILRLTLPYPPSVNHYWRSVRGGRVILSEEALAYKQEVAVLLYDLEPLAGAIGIRAAFYRPRRVGDLDNLCKGFLDSLNGLAYLDDSQIIHLELDRDDDKHNPRVELELWSYL